MNDKESTADARAEAKHDAACERAEQEKDAVIAEMPRDRYNALAVEFLAERQLENEYRDWLVVEGLVTP
jgi:hypothetical protein